MFKSFFPNADTRNSAAGHELVGGCRRTRGASGGHGRTGREANLETKGCWKSRGAGNVFSLDGETGQARCPVREAHSVVMGTLPRRLRLGRLRPFVKNSCGGLC